MKKLIMIVAAAFVLILLGCQKHQADYAEVYNAAGQRVATIKNEAGIKKLSAVTGRLGSAKKTTLPAGAKVAYRYVMHVAKTGDRITLTVYRGKDAVKTKGISALGAGPWHVSKKDAAMLEKPSQLK